MGKLPMDAYKYGDPFTAITDLDKEIVKMEAVFNAQIGNLGELLAAAMKRIADFEEKNRPTPKKRKSTKDAKATTGET